MRRGMQLTELTATNAASTGIEIERSRLKAFARRTDRHGLIFLGKWASVLAVTGTLLWASLGAWWMWPSLFVHGVVLTLPAYAVSHETAHGTALRTRWLNELVFWLASLLYLEEPLHRRYTHTNHHTFTWHVGRDSQMPFDLPLNFTGWIKEVSGIALLWFHAKTLWSLSTANYSTVLREVAPESEFPRMTRNARLFVLLYLSAVTLIAAGILWPLWFFILPRLLAAPVLMMFTLLQHAEMREDSMSITESTRSFHTNGIAKFLYMNMNHHIEHHLYPQVPFHSLPLLSQHIQERLPTPDSGCFRTNWEILSVVTRRSLGRNTKARRIRQASSMVSEGGYSLIARKTM